MKSNTFNKKQSMLVDSKKAKRTVRASTTMGMEGLGKGSGRTIGKMDMGSSGIRMGLRFRAIGLMGSRVRTECRQDDFGIRQCN